MQQFFVKRTWDLDGCMKTQSHHMPKLKLYNSSRWAGLWFLTPCLAAQLRQTIWLSTALERDAWSFLDSAYGRNDQESNIWCFQMFPRRMFEFCSEALQLSFMAMSVCRGLFWLRCQASVDGRTHESEGGGEKKSIKKKGHDGVQMQTETYQMIPFWINAV